MRNAQLPILSSLALLAAPPLVCQQPADASAVRALDDSSIADTVERELDLDPGVAPDGIDISARDGIVTLTGHADSLLAKERAARVAETVKGVRSVVNRVAIATSRTIPDDELRQRVVDALFYDPATDAYELEVAVDGGCVTLGGTVDAWAEKELSETVAKGVAGVCGLTSEITVSYAETPSDTEIRAAVEQRLHWDHLIDDGLIEVEVADGTVKLRGTVGSAAEKSRAEGRAWTAGVDAVDTTSLSVARWARDEDLREHKYVSKPDDEVRTALEDALAHDPRVLSFEVDTDVSRGVATLRGVVDNLKAKRAAEQDAMNTVGVHFVRNHLKVRPTAVRPDTELENDVRAALRRDPYVDRFEIDVVARDGTVHLLGTVGTQFERMQADDAAARVNGVVSVANHLDVSVPRPLAYDARVDMWGPYDRPFSYTYAPVVTHRTDWTIQREIENELWWSPYVDSDAVTVEVEDGVATLTGTVGSWDEWRAARKNAYDGGATLVHNRIDIDAEGGAE